jgi:hypothetical protein
MTRRFFWIALVPLLAAGILRAESKTYEVTVAAGEHDRVNEPVTVLLPLPVTLARAAGVTVKAADGKELPAQVTAPGLLAKLPATDDSAPREVHFILPAASSGRTPPATSPS